MLNFILFLLIGVGITNIVVNASILEPFRDFITKKSTLFGKLISCMLCTGFWVGILLWLVDPKIFESFSMLAPICAGAVISLLSSFYDILTDYLLFIDEDFDETED